MATWKCIIKNSVRASILMTVALLFFSCESMRKQSPELAWTPPSDPSSPNAGQIAQTYAVTDQKEGVERDEYSPLPEWVRLYLGGGEQMVEGMGIYEKDYVFIKENSGENKEVLLRWAENFSVDRNFPRMVASRVQRRLERSISSYPDRVYGSFFERAIKACSDEQYDGAVKREDFWFQKHIVREAGEATDRYEYQFLVLVSVEKSSLQAQLNRILAQVPLDSVSFQNQLDAAENVKSAFFSNF